MKKILLSLIILIPFIGFSQNDNCVDLTLSFDPVIYSFCDANNDCLEFNIYGEGLVIYNINLGDIAPNEETTYCLPYSIFCEFSASFSGEVSGMGAELFYARIKINDNQTTINYSDSWSTNLCGCTNPLAENYNSDAVADDNSCIISGCTNPLAENYNQNATNEDNSCIVSGCTDPNAFNFNPTANLEDNSCVDVIYGCLDQNAFNYNELANTDNQNCSYCTFSVETLTQMPSSSTSCDGFIYVNPDGQSPYVINWSNNVTSQSNPILCNGYYSYEIYDANGCYSSSTVLLSDYSGCTDPMAFNYNAEATLDDGSCQEFIYGCTDSLAQNYSILANTDDGSCIDCSISFMQLQSFDNSAGQCDGFAYALASSPDGDVLYSWSNGSTINSASNLCTGIYTVVASLDGGCSLSHQFTIGEIIEGCTDSEAFNYNSEALIEDGSCIAKVPGCTEELADNYMQSANFNDGSCFYTILGCTDQDASNYNSQANQDNGNCQYPCTSNNVQIVMYDNLGNGWGTGFYRVSNSLGQTVVTGNLAEGAYAVDSLCLPSDCYSFDVIGAGIGSIEILWEVRYQNITILTGTGQQGYSFTLNECAILGCMDVSACNYNSNATLDNGQCSFSEEFYTCQNECQNDTDLDGVCDELEIYGCTNSTAINFNTEATEDDSSCEYEAVNDFPCDITPSGMYVDNIIHNRVVFNWSTPSAAPSHYMIRYRAVGNNSWIVMTAGPVNSNEFNGTSRSRYFMDPGTTYQWSMRARVLNEDGTMDCQSSWSANSEYTTLPQCANLENLSVSTEANWVNLMADAPAAEWGVWQSKGKMREAETNSYRYVNGDSQGAINFLKGNFDASTDYEWHTKAWCTANVDADGNSDPMYHSGWGDFFTFSTEDACDKLPSNLITITNGAQNAIVMNWDTPQSGAPDHYFLELTNETTGQLFQWNNIAGNSNSKTKYGQTAGNEYSWKIRGACGTNGTSWATSFTSPAYYTLGAERIESNSLSSLKVYPNPSKGVLHIKFNVEQSQDVELSVINSIGQEVYFEKVSVEKLFNGSVDLSQYAKGIYNLSAKTNTGTTNHRLILQ
jgi:hypothetical protein